MVLSDGQPRRRWQLIRRKYELKHTMGPGLPTWIETCWKPFGVGCLVCRAATASRSVWASCGVECLGALKTWKFNRHEKSHSHRIALASMLESAGMWAGGEGSETVAPSEKDFETVFHHTVMHPVGKGARDAAKGKKTRKMLWCLAESHREKKRRLWSDCAELSMTLMQDVRNGRLNARYVCCTDRMVHVSGYLSTVNLARDFSLDSIGIQKGTLEHLRRACTSCVAPPYNDRQIPSSF